MFDWNQPNDPQAASQVGHRAFDYANGFGTAFGGFDTSYTTKDERATVHLDLRFGEGAARLIGQNGNDTWAVLNQAYVTLVPYESKKLSLDFGQFNTIYGAEVANSWENLNYTRGALYYLMQPFYHTGIRANYAASDSFGLTFMVVNGTNNPIDNNQTPHVGVQASFALSDAISAVVGYYGGAGSSGFGNTDEPSSEDDFEHFVDVVINAAFGKVSVVGNFDLYISGDESGRNQETGELQSSTYWGASLAVGYQATDKVGIAVRGELLKDDDLYIGNTTQLTTGTFTLDYRAVDHVIIRLDQRFESADDEIFVGKDGDMEKTWMSTTIGVVVTSN
ncbi:MAG: outer membrane beta-barrel protein [Bradymonadia bacterium]